MSSKSGDTVWQFSVISNNWKVKLMNSACKHPKLSISLNWSHKTKLALPNSGVLSYSENVCKKLRFIFENKHLLGRDVIIYLPVVGPRAVFISFFFYPPPGRRGARQRSSFSRARAFQYSSAARAATTRCWKMYRSLQTSTVSYCI